MLRFRRAVGAAALALGLLAACGGGGNSGVSKDPDTALKAAADRTADAGSVKMDLDVRMSSGSKLASGRGAFDFKKNQGRFTLSSSMGFGFDLVFTADKVYSKNPRPRPGEKAWTAVDETDQSNVFIGQLRSQLDPRDAMRNFDTMVTDVTKVGSEKIRGENTTHLRGTVDLSDEAIAKASAKMRENLRQSQATFGKDGYPIDVWLDDDGRVRRVQFPMSGGAMAMAGPTTVTMDLYGYGEDPEIDVPGPDEVQESTTTTS